MAFWPLHGAVAARTLPAVEPGILPRGIAPRIPFAPDKSDTLSGGKMPPSTAGMTPAATFYITLFAKRPPP
jgi:hypothetical protein